ncbi:hypothetical protein TSUD_184460 [Trifolium subterraneum]|uniref:Integrase catalytic domain-containing protein n=1 Tax=Trifolium subterraneum TaxID=3900 RepID=A0A2Z6NQT4_TRISU|nr:hypothetical protein TSUD_184460 [Trifolium subterraneum]
MLIMALQPFSGSLLMAINSIQGLGPALGTIKGSFPQLIRYDIFYTENLCFTKTDLSVGAPAGTQPPVVSLDRCKGQNNLIPSQLVDSDQEFVGENVPLNPQHSQRDGHETSVTLEDSTAHAQVTPLDVTPLQQELPAQEDPLVVPQGAAMEVLARSSHRRRSPTPKNRPERSRSRSTRHQPRKKPKSLSPRRIAEPRRNHRSPPPRNNRSPPPRNNRSPPPRNGEAVKSGGVARPIPQIESSGTLKAIVQGPEEPLRSYIERFNKVDVEIETYDKMKLYLLEDGLRQRIKFHEAVGVEEMKTLDEFFERAQQYIKWEEKQRFGEDCVHLKDAIEILIQKGYVRQYVEVQGQTRNGDNARQAQLAIEAPSPEQETPEVNKTIPGGVAFAVSRPEDFLPPTIISGGGFNPVTIGSVKRKEEVPGGSPNFQIPLLVRAKMANFDLRRILVDQGSSCDIMIQWSNNQALGYVDLIFTFEEDKAMKSVKVKFLVIDCPSLYNCIIGRPTLAELFAVSSTIHLKLKYYTKNGQFATINGDIEAARKCFEAASKNLNYVVTPKKKKDEAKLPGVNSISTEDADELDARTSKKERKQEKKAMNDDLLIKENYRPIPDGEFELVPLGEDPASSKRHQDWSATYQRMMNKVFRNEIGDMLEVQSRKCTFRVKAGKFLGFYLTERGIKANPDKCKAFFEYPTPKSNKSIQTLNGMLTSMARFVAKSVQHALPLFKLLRKETTFEWIEECKGALQHLKRALSEPPVLTRPVEGEKLYLYLVVASEAISAVLIRETEQGQKHVYFEMEVKHVHREHNSRANVLSKLASTRRKNAGNQSLLQETLTKASIEKAIEVMHICAIDDQSLMAPVYNFLKSNTLPADAKEATKVRRRACAYVLLDDKLYRRGFSIPLLKCVEEVRMEFTLQEIHEGINGQHIGERSLAKKALRAGYYWPTMQNNAKDHVLKCDKCQRHRHMHLAPASELKALISLWPFAWWGMDILGPFPTASRQVKYLIVDVDYFKKWIKAEPLAKIAATHILRFFKRNVLARFGVLRVVVTDNGTQFTNKKFQEFLDKIGTTQHFTSVEHPQTNGKVEATNRVILRGAKTKTRRIQRKLNRGIAQRPMVLLNHSTFHNWGNNFPINIRNRGSNPRGDKGTLPEDRIPTRGGCSARQTGYQKRIRGRKPSVKKNSREGKLAANWEGPYRVRAKKKMERINSKTSTAKKSLVLGTPRS